MQIFEELDSTQLEAKRQIDVKGVIVEDAILARKQIAGVSTKKDYPWIAQDGDLTVSIIFNSSVLEKNGSLTDNLLSFPAGLAILDEILEVKKQSGRNFEPVLKWPNDILINNNGEYRKVCGTLCDNYKGHFVIGIGCNLVSYPGKTQHFPATDLFSQSGIQLDCVEMANKLLVTIKDNILQMQNYGFDGLKNKWKQHAYMLGKTLILRDEGEVVFEDIDDKGCILARKQDGTIYTICESDEVIGGINK